MQTGACRLRQNQERVHRQEAAHRGSPHRQGPRGFRGVRSQHEAGSPRPPRISTRPPGIQLSSACPVSAYRDFEPGREYFTPLVRKFSRISIADQESKPTMPKTGEPTQDHVAIVACQKGDHDSFGILVRRYERQLMGHALALLGNREDALDMIQETFVRAFKSISTFQTGSYRSSRFYCFHKSRIRFAFLRL